VIARLGPAVAATHRLRGIKIRREFDNDVLELDDADVEPLRVALQVRNAGGTRIDASLASNDAFERISAGSPYWFLREGCGQRDARRSCRPPPVAKDARMPTEAAKGPASYFPSIEKKYGRPIGDWQQLVRAHLPAKHMDLVSMLKAEHGMGHGHANAIVAHVLSEPNR
jgi:hypothetical protein